jgi:hypothetical protein
MGRLPALLFTRRESASLNAKGEQRRAKKLQFNHPKRTKNAKEILLGPRNYKLSLAEHPTRQEPITRSYQVARPFSVKGVLLWTYALPRAPRCWF